MNTAERSEIGAKIIRLERAESQATPMYVGDLMTTQVVTLSPHDSYAEAVGLMANRPFRHFLVVEDDGRLVGVVSDRDLLRALARKFDWQRTTVGDVMTRGAVTARTKTPLSDATELLLRHRINCLAVTDETDRVLGIMTSTDLLRAFQGMQAELERDFDRKSARHG